MHRRADSPPECCGQQIGIGRDIEQLTIAPALYVESIACLRDGVGLAVQVLLRHPQLFVCRVELLKSREHDILLYRSASLSAQSIHARLGAAHLLKQTGQSPFIQAPCLRSSFAFIASIHCFRSPMSHERIPPGIAFLQSCRMAAWARGRAPHARPF
jgi:hypothetical protein